MNTIKIEKHNRNKLTISKDETRLKLNGEDDLKLESFAETIVREFKLAHPDNIVTVRGAFAKNPAGKWYVCMKSDRNTISMWFTEC